MKSTTTKKAPTKVGKTKPKSNAADGLRALLEDELKDIYWAEKALTKAIPKMIKNVSTQKLKDALSAHLEETKTHVGRCEQVFKLLDKPVKAKKCEAIAGLIKEAEEIIESTEIGVVRDAGIILAAQKVEHYEIATYGTLRTFAGTLGENKVKALLQTTLDEEKGADVKLTVVAESSINVKAAKEGEE